MLVEETGKIQQSVEDIPKTTASKSHGLHAEQFNFGRYKGRYPATKREIHYGCFPRNFAKL